MLPLARARMSPSNTKLGSYMRYMRIRLRSRNQENNGRSERIREETENSREIIPNVFPPTVADAFPIVTVYQFACIYRLLRWGEREREGGSKGERGIGKQGEIDLEMVAGE